jgi:folate-binding protein YgfZ
VTTSALPEIDAQYRELREGAGLLERPERATLEVKGPAAGEFLQGQVTNDVPAIELGTGCYAAMLNPKGRIVADMRILRSGDEAFLLDTEADAHAAVLRDLRMYKIGRQVDVIDTAADTAVERVVISLLGPRSDEVTEAATGTRPGASEHDIAEAGAVLLVRTDVGIDLIVPAAGAGELRRQVLEAGAHEISPQAAEIVRIEGGRPRHGVDMTADNLPAEAGIVDRAVSFTKGCYVGQEPVARMHYKGHPNRHLRGLRLGATAPAGTQLFASGGKEVGTITSSALSPALGPVALALIRREVVPGVVVAVGAEGPDATVVELPFQFA